MFLWRFELDTTLVCYIEKRIVKGVELESLIDCIVSYKFDTSIIASNFYDQDQLLGREFVVSV